MLNVIKELIHEWAADNTDSHNNDLKIEQGAELTKLVNSKVDRFNSIIYPLIGDDATNQPLIRQFITTCLSEYRAEFVAMTTCVAHIALTTIEANKGGLEHIMNIYPSLIMPKSIDMMCAFRDWEKDGLISKTEYDVHISLLHALARPGPEQIEAQNTMLSLLNGVAKLV
jgi:hypothetical protein